MIEYTNPHLKSKNKSQSQMRKIIRKLVEIGITWKMLHILYKLFYRFKFEKDLIQIEKDQNELREKEERLKARFSDLTVRNGLFKGMKYPEFIAHGSSMFAKLLGSYESELYGEIEALLKNKYKTIFDVGCAEGYYAVGMAMLNPEAIIYAYDINEKALQACREMAKINKVDSRMRFENFCYPELLAEFNFKERALIICDCEGYEAKLFTPEAVKNLVNCDVLIEVHDLYDEKILPSIEEVFNKTHNIKLVYSQNTFKKLRSSFALENFTDDDIRTFFCERNGIMQWAIITKK
jgi:hypothetical protein